MWLFDGKKVSYIIHTYNPDPTMTGEEIAAVLYSVVKINNL